ncbi:hypothetical protein [Rhizobium phage RHph_X3_9]|nr:hypothetical protein [Rhizobium phage RHph_X3_9]
MSKNIKAELNNGFKAISVADLYRGEQTIATKLKSIHNRGQKLQRDVHIAACSILQHVEENRDMRVVQKFIGMLVNSMPEAYRVNALRDWLAEFGPIAWDNNKPVYVADKKTELTAAMATPFWKLSPEKPYQPVDFDKSIDALIQKLRKDTEQTMTDHSFRIAALEACKKAAPAAPEVLPAAVGQSTEQPRILDMVH